MIGGYSPAVVPGLLLLPAVACLAASTGSRALRLQQLQLTGSRAQAQELWHTSLVAPRCVGSAGPGIEPWSIYLSIYLRAPCIDRWILNRWTTREAPELLHLFCCLSVKIHFESHSAVKT